MCVMLTVFVVGLLWLLCAVSALVAVLENILCSTIYIFVSQIGTTDEGGCVCRETIQRLVKHTT